MHREPPFVPEMRDERLQPMPGRRRKPFRVAVGGTPDGALWAG